MLHPRFGSLRFQSTPSVRRATTCEEKKPFRENISIHALREEGDAEKAKVVITTKVFQSTPSVRRATVVHI